jgi:hypothetical protein
MYISIDSLQNKDANFPLVLRVLNLKYLRGVLRGRRICLRQEVKKNKGSSY